MPSMFEFEEPLDDLKERIATVRQFGKKHDLDLTFGLSELNSVFPKLKRKFFESLTPWRMSSWPVIPSVPIPRTTSG